MFKSNKISSEKIHKIIKCFCEDIPATKTAAIFDLNRKTVDRYYHFLQNILLEKALLDASIYKIPSKEIQSCHALFTEKDAGLQAACCNKSLVLGLIEKEGKVFLVCEGTVEQKTIDSLIKKRGDLNLSFFFVGAIGLEPMNSNESGFTVRSNCRYATLPNKENRRWFSGHLFLRLALL